MPVDVEVDRLVGADPGDPSDGDLLARWQEHADELALERLVARHRAMVDSTCRRILAAGGAVEDCDDAVQETFIALSARPPQALASVGAWLRTVATNRSLMQLRARRRRHQERLEEEPATRERSGTGWEEEVLGDCLAHLSDQDRDLVVRLFYIGESQAMVARRKRVSRAAVHQHLQRVLAELRSRLARRGLRVGIPALLLLLAGGERGLAAAVMAAPPWLQRVLPARPTILGLAIAWSALLLVGVGLALWLMPTASAGVPGQSAGQPSPPPSPLPPSLHPAGDPAMVASAPAGGGIPGVFPMASLAIDDLLVSASLIEDHVRRWRLTGGQAVATVPFADSPQVRMVELPWEGGPVRAIEVTVPPGGMVTISTPAEFPGAGRQALIAAATGDRRRPDWKVVSLSTLTVPGRGHLIEHRVLACSARYRATARQWVWNGQDELRPEQGVTLSADCWLLGASFAGLSDAEAAAVVARCPGQQGIEPLADGQ